jgi:hypothetical protein
MTKPPRKPSCDDYEVGHGKPPSRTRFRKGTSGNPRGRHWGMTGGPHINNVKLGRFSRSNVWDYPGQNVLNGTSKSKLSLHPTVKPVALVADAIRDCSHRNGIILDSFGGAGTTLIAAEKTGRRARLTAIDPRYVDVTIKRWQNVTGRTAVNADTGTPYSENGSQPVRTASLTIEAETRSDNGAIS